MTCLSYQDEFLIVSVSVCMVTYWTRLIKKRTQWLSSCHDYFKLLCCMVWVFMQVTIYIFNKDIIISKKRKNPFIFGFGFPSHKQSFWPKLSKTC